MAKITVFLIFTLLIALPVAAERQAAPGPADARVRTVTYNPRDVVQLLAHYGYQTLIRFADVESIENISIGDSLAWQVVPNERGNLLFIKPVERNAETNLTVVTGRPSSTDAAGIEQRVYVFSLIADESDAHDSSDFTWTVQFHYPADDAELLHRQTQSHKLGEQSILGATPNIDPADWNFNYSFAGHSAQVPLKIFDNGTFTYFEFDALTDTPAIFLVDEDRNEALVNSVRQGKYLVVHRVGRQFTLRNGNTVTCIFNESYPSSPALDQGSPVQRDASVTPASSDPIAIDAISIDRPAINAAPSTDS